MARSDFELLSLLVAEPTLTVEEAARLLDKSEKTDSELRIKTFNPVAAQTRQVVAHTLGTHQTPPFSWSN